MRSSRQSTQKRPPNAYALYVQDRAPEMNKDHPDMHPNDVFRELGEQWQNMAEKEKDEYYGRYEELKKEYEDETGIVIGEKTRSRISDSRRSTQENEDTSRNKRGKYTMARRSDAQDTDDESVQARC